MQEETKTGLDIAAFFTKSGSWVFSVIFGLFGKIGMDLMMKKKYTWYQWIGIMMISLFSGYIGGLMSIYWGWYKPDNLYKMFMTVSLMTTFGQNAALYCVYNYKRIGNGIVDSIFRGKSK